ncbi:MAG: trifunctional transcriptional activator/DNA repair protein Ada/methylated-DNA--[protein]-cysteine S-methyltransferase [Caulobacterales bacterium]|nr:trifunctional transcriptional activator/DNA repair protein Ada/methylated-DNA--[protein]-cysteine S-methyltransferase [Caulobacterales bacterium]
MLGDRDDDDTLYAALLARDPSYDGRAFVGVTSTGVFCRLTCPARKPKRENSRFFPNAAAAFEAGFRPCRRCRPLHAMADADPVVTALLDALAGAPDRRWSEHDIAAMGFDASTVRRAFKRRFGATFLQLARLWRLRRGAETLSANGKVIEAQLEAGFESASGFRAAFARVLGEPPARAQSAARLRASWIDTPIGVMIAVADARALALLEFFDRAILPSELRRLQARAESPIGVGRTGPIEQIEAELKAYFRGEAAHFETPLAPCGGPFAQTVWRALRAIPPGETRSYARLAAAIGRPTAARAVARANAANPIAIVTPCHRVIGSDGALTGYGGGLWRKRWLLEHERALAGHAAPADREITT